MQGQAPRRNRATTAIGKRTVMRLCMMVTVPIALPAARCRT